jgi:hypothetical protein
VPLPRPLSRRLSQSIATASVAVLAGCGLPALPGPGATGDSPWAGTHVDRSSSTSATTGGTTGGPTAREARDALAALDRIPVKGRAPKTGYDRDRFGPAWTDDVDVRFGHNGCDTRNDILRRDLTRDVLKPGTHGCVVLSGHLADPYTGRQIDFVRGAATSTLVQIDHVVALGDAWVKGAQQLTDEDRRRLANDPLNLLAVDGKANSAKRDGDAATWLPSNKPFRCAYVTRQVEVKVRYHLWVTAAEKSAIGRILDACAP